MKCGHHAGGSSSSKPSASYSVSAGVVSARTSLKACLDAKLSGPVADAAGLKLFLADLKVDPRFTSASADGPRPRLCSTLTRSGDHLALDSVATSRRAS